MKKVLLITLVMLLSFSTALFAGGKKEEAMDEMGTAASSQFEGIMDISYDGGWEIGKKGGRLVMGQLGDPKTFNMVIADETSTTDVTERLYEPLFQRNQFTLDWEPSLAESYEISADEKTITVKLRKGLKWSDGTPITTRDVVDAVNMIYYNEDVEGSTRDALSGAGGPSVWEAIDDLTFTMTLPEVYAGMFSILNLPAPVPMHVMGPILEKEGAAGINSLWGVDADVTQIPSCGPFVISEYIPSQRIIMKRNPNYFKKDAKGTQLPYIDELVYEIITDQDTQLQKFLAGDLNFHAIRGADYAAIIDRKEEVGFELYNVGPATSTNFITFNQNPIEGGEDAGIPEPQLTWLSNKTFRHAMAHCVDRETIVNNVLYGFGYPQYSFVPVFSPYYYQDAEADSFGFDLEKAKELLDSIGYKDTDGDGWREDSDGNKIVLTLNTNSGNRDREAIGEIFTQAVRSVGIDLTFKPEDFNAMVGRLVSSYDWEMILIGLTGSVDPISGVNVYQSSGNLHMIEPGQASPRRDWEKTVDAAWKTANNTTSEAQRKEGWEIIQKAWIEEVPWVFTTNAAVLHAYDTSFGNIYPQPVEDYDWEGVLEYIYVK